MNIYLEAQSWCLKNNIKIYIVPIANKKECTIEINNNGKIIKSPLEYKNQKIASDKIWDLFLYLYKQKEK
jgi:hypothetical protein